MRRLLILIFLICSFAIANQVRGQEAESTTWFVVRHADRNGEKDELTQAGKVRAEHLRELMKVLRVNVVYSTNTKRTQETAAPTAKALDLTVTSYGKLTKEWFEQIKTKHKGKIVLIVGHSNTAGAVVQGLGGKGDFSIDDDEYDSLFVVTTGKQGSQAVRLRFGKQIVPERK